MYTLIPAYGSCCIPGDVVGTLSLRTISSHYLLTLAVRTAWSHCPFARAVDDAPLCRPFATSYPRCQLTLPVRRRPSATPICAGHSRRAVHAADPRCSSRSTSAGALRDARLHWPFATPVRAANSHCPSHSPSAGALRDAHLRSSRRLSALPTRTARSQWPSAMTVRAASSPFRLNLPVRTGRACWRFGACAPRAFGLPAYHRPSAPFQGSPGTPKLGATRGSRARVM